MQKHVKWHKYTAMQAETMPSQPLVDSVLIENESQKNSCHDDIQR